ncbi:MAG: NgoFVII family restriction endonuclease, partial [Abditibacteriota bacterium]|nr:NgoFVII family restriction endonuclease [Abditibacteriota bacterium]
MSFYDEMTTEEERLNYSLMLEMIGSLSNLFSESPSPYLASRISENLFCRCFFADNLSRNDVTADAKRGKTGIGIKTWTGSQSQKIAEFDALRNTYINDEPEILISKVAGYRNDRIQKTLDTYSIDTMVYHCLLRTEGLISVYECPLVKIDVGNITKIKKTGASIYFEDGINAYSFNLSKSTLFKRFDDLELMNEIPVTIIEDPYEYLAEKMGLLDKIKRLQIRTEPGVSHIETAYLPLYSFNNKAGFFVPPKECLNIRFAGGRRRDPY